MNPQTRKRIAREWLTLLVCLLIGFGLGFLDWSIADANLLAAYDRAAVEHGFSDHEDFEGSYTEGSAVDRMLYGSLGDPSADVPAAQSRYHRFHSQMHSHTLKWGAISGAIVYALFTLVRSVIWAVKTVKT